MKQAKNTLRKVLIGVAVICLVLAAGIPVVYFLTDWYNEDVSSEYRTPSDLITELPTVDSSASEEIPANSDSVISTDSSSDAGASSSEESTDSSVPDMPESTDTQAEAPTPIENPYTDAFLANEDMVGWLVIPGTVVDYPVMWTPGNENYYLKRGFDKKKNNDGCLILDTDSALDPLTTNLIIHGHYKKSGTMFACLHNYKDKEYYEEHKQITLYTEEVKRNYEVIAVFRSQVFLKTDTVFKYYKFFQANTQAEFNDFYNNIKKMSIYDTGVTAEFGDHFITLSTCAYHVENGRFVVVAKEIDSTDTYLPIER